MLKRFKAHAEIKAAEPGDDGDLIVEGVASTGDVDREGEVVDQESLADAASRAKSVPIFWQHNWDAPIGRVLEMAPSDGKLLARVAIGRDFDVPVGGSTMPVNSIRSMIQQKIVNAFSIGFAANMEKSADDQPILKVTDLFEISVVTIPANANALFSVSKAARSPYGVDFAFDQPATTRNKVAVASASRFGMDEDDEAVARALEALIRGASSELRQDVGAHLVQKELSECLTLIRSPRPSKK